MRAATNAAVAAANGCGGVLVIDSAIGVEQAVFASVAAWRVLALLADFVAVVITGEAFVDVGTTGAVTLITYVTFARETANGIGAVSYTHLTLPTILLV